MSVDDKTTVIFEQQFQSKGIEKLQADMAKLQKNFNLALNKMNNNMKVNNKLQRLNTQATEKYRNSIMSLKRGMIAFFFVTREMAGLLRPAAQIVGIFDLWNTILTVTFLPAALWFMENFMIPLTNLMLGLDPAIQLVIGGITALGVALGALSFASTILGFGNLYDVVKKLPGSFKSTKEGLSALQTLAIAGVAVKAIFDLKAFEEGEITLRQYITTLGDDIGLLGLALGKPWMIGIGLIPRLLPMGEKIAESGKNLVDISKERLKGKNNEFFAPLGGLALGGTMEVIGAGLSWGDKGLNEMTNPKNQQGINITLNTNVSGVDRAKIDSIVNQNGRNLYMDIAKLISSNKS